MSGLGCCGAALGVLLAGAVAGVLWCEYEIGSGVHAEYPGRVSFTGGGHFFRMTYYGTAWVRDGHDPQPCPYVIHLADGDLTAADLANPWRLVARGWARLTDDNELAAGMPLVLVHREGDYSVNLTYSGGTLTCVTVGAASADAARPDARGIAVTVLGGRVSFPAPEEDLVKALGRPTRRTREPGY